MTIGVVLVGRFGGDHQPSPYQGRAEDIHERFNRISRERVRMPKDSSREFAPGKDCIGAHAQQSRPQTALKSVPRHIGKLRSGPVKKKPQ